MKKTLTQHLNFLKQITLIYISSMVALEDGVCQPGDTVDVGNGIFMYKGARMTDHNKHRGGYKKITVAQAIWYSSNIGVAKTILKGYANNPTKFVEGLYRIGMNADLHLEIPGAGKAKIRRPDDTLRYWSKTTLPWMSFGYETQTLPVRLLPQMPDRRTGSAQSA